MPAALLTDQKATSTLKLEAYHQGLIKVIGALIHIDNILVIWPYKYPNLPKLDLLTKPSNLGTLIHQILHYFDKFCINKILSTLYICFLIGFDIDLDKFISSAMVMLEDVLAKIYKLSMQVPHIASLGWLFGMHEDFSLPTFESLLYNTVKMLAPNQMPQIQFGLTYKPIYDGTLHKE